MMLGQKHSLCLISMLSKAQPSESIPTKNACLGSNPVSVSAETAVEDVAIFPASCPGWFSGPAYRILRRAAEMEFAQTQELSFRAEPGICIRRQNCRSLAPLGMTILKRIGFV